MPIDLTFARPQPNGLLVVAVLHIVTGCSMWNTSESTGVPKLPQPQMSRDSVGVEVATVTLEFDQGREFDEILRGVDEQIVPVPQRRLLAENGIRGGLLGSQLPGPLRLLLLEAENRRKHPTAETFGIRQDQQRFIQCRSGKRYSIELWEPTAKLDFEHVDGETTRRETFDDASFQLALHCTPERNCCATIKLIPQIQHGPLRQRFVAQSDSFHMEARRDQVVYDDLAIEFRLSAGETALITCDAEGGLGPSLFRNSDATQQKILLIRLAQTQLDELFLEDADTQLTGLSQ